MSESVLDASALLALLNREPSAERVADAVVAGARMSAVNLSEVVSKLAESGMPAAAIRQAIEPLGIAVIGFDTDSAFVTGLLRPLTRAAGLSLGDRACLALGQLSETPVLTADRGWSDIELGSGIEIETLR